MPVFKTKRLQGVDYPLGHLDNLQFQVFSGSNTYTIETIFSCHCFTETVQPHHTPDWIYTHRGERRAFDLDRYTLSQNLPQLVTALGGKSVYYTKGANNFFMRAIAGLNGPYVVFFDTFKSTKKPNVDVILNIQSAYCKPNMVTRAAPILFPVLVEAMVTKQPAVRGPFETIKRK